MPVGSAALGLTVPGPGRQPGAVDDLRPARRTLADAAARTAELLAALPSPANRSPDQRLLAARAKQSVRVLRGRFVATHARDIYAEVTDGMQRCVRLAGIAAAVADSFPGLVPGRDQMAAENGRLQADKEDHEIDYAILFSGLLRSQPVGMHLLDSMLRPTPRAERLLGEYQRAGAVVLDSVRLERRDGTAHLTICRPTSLNAEDVAQVEDMETAVDLALLDPASRVGVIRGGPTEHPRYAGRRVFSAGINLKQLHAGKITFLDFLLRRELGYISKIIRGLLFEHPESWHSPTVQKPWLAAVDTFAIGGGAQLLLAMDHVVAGSDAYVSLPAADEGIIPGAAALRLPGLVGGRLSRQLVLGGRRIRADEPAADRLIDEVVAPDQVGRAASAAADRLDAPAIVANRRMLNQVLHGADALRSYLAEFAIQQAVRLYSPDVLSKVGRFTAGRRNGGPA